MSPPLSLALQYVLRDAPRLAEEIGHRPSTAHHLLHVTTFENPARTLLTRYQLSRSLLARASKGAPADAQHLLESLRERCATLADKFKSEQTDCIHLLCVLCKTPESVAFGVLQAAGADVAELRRVIVRHLAEGPRVRGLGATVLPKAATTPAKAQAKTRTKAGRPANRPASAGKEGGASAVTGRMERRQGDERRQEDGAGANGATDGAQTSSQPGGDAGAYSLDPDRFPLLDRLGRNLTEEAAMGLVDPVVGRQTELVRIGEILRKRQSNAPLLVGPPGVGKTALVAGLARAIVHRPEAAPGLEGRIIVSVDSGALLAGTSFRGALSERIRDLRDEVKRSKGRVVVFLDEVHQLLDPGGGADAANDLKTALAGGRFPVIAATTEEELRSKVEADPALLRRFTVVQVDEPTPEEARNILGGLKGLYEESHGVLYTDDALDAAVRLSHRFIVERHLPHKALDLMDLAGVRAQRLGWQQVDRELVAEVTAEIVDVPTERLLLTNAERLLRMEDEMAARVVGHGEAVRKLSDVVRRNQAGFAADRPIGSFLFLGPTGVGKTETAKVLADFLFDSRDSMTQIDMSEYAESHAMARLIGAPPGYVGHEAGGQLTEAIRRRPYQVLLLDEVEKAHIDVLKVLLQLLEEGRLTDGRGRRVSFSNAVVILTSNLGAERFTGVGGGPGGASKRRAGFTPAPDPAAAMLRDDEGAVSVPPDVIDGVMADARDHFPPELWNRIEEKLLFEPLSRSEVGRVATMLIAESSARLQRSKRISFEADAATIRHLIDNGGWSPDLGARPMRRTIQTLLENELATGIHQRRYAAGDHVLVTCPGDDPAAGLRFTKTDQAKRRTDP